MKLPPVSPPPARPREHVRGPVPAGSERSRQPLRRRVVRRRRESTFLGQRLGAELFGRTLRLGTAGLLLAGLTMAVRTLLQDYQDDAPWVAATRTYLPWTTTSAEPAKAARTARAEGRGWMPWDDRPRVSGEFVPARSTVNTPRGAAAPHFAPAPYVAPPRVAYAAPAGHPWMFGGLEATARQVAVARASQGATGGASVPTAPSAGAAPSAPRKAIMSSAIAPQPQASGTTLYVQTNNPGFGGTYVSSPYTVSAGGDSYQYIFAGYNGVGVINDPAGALTAAIYLSVGDQPGGNGTFNLSGTGSINTPETDVGFAGTGLFNQTGGTHTVGATGLLIGYDRTAANGTYNLQGGTLNTQKIAFGTGTGTLNLNGGTLQASVNTTNFITNGSGTATINVQSGGAKIDTQAFSVTIAQPLVHDTTTGAAAIDGGLAKTGAGTLTLSEANTFTGGTTVTGGTLNLANQLALQNSTLTLSNASGSGTVTFDSTVKVNAFTVGGLSGNGNLALANNAGDPAAVALSVGNNNQSTTYAGTLSGAGSLAKIGTGTLTLSGANTYAGTTTVSAGKLLVTGSLQGVGMLTVGSGGTLGGTGTVNGAVSVQANGTFQPGVGSSGRLTLGNSLLLTNTAVASFTIGGTTGNLLNTQAYLSGVATLGGSTLALTLATGYTPTVGDKFFLIDHSSPAGFSGQFAQGTTFTQNGVTYQVNYADNDPNNVGIIFFPFLLSSTGGPVTNLLGFSNDLSLTIVAVPEPGTWAGLAVGLAAVGWAVRANRRQLRA